MSTLDTFVSFAIERDGSPRPINDPYREDDFDTVIRQWFPLAELLNELNRSMGLNDPYPFVLTPTAVAKADTRPADPSSRFAGCRRVAQSPNESEAALAAG